MSIAVAVMSPMLLGILSLLYVTPVIFHCVEMNVK